MSLNLCWIDTSADRIRYLINRIISNDNNCYSCSGIVSLLLWFLTLPPPPGEACTIVLRGATQQILDEAERSLHDALCVLAQTVKEPRTVFGGGCSEMLMAKVVADLANRTPGKEAVAMESFAKALMMVWMLAYFTPELLTFD